MLAAYGTFDSIPKLYHQLYKIHPLRDDSAVPAISLFAKEKKDLYLKLLRALLTLKPNIKSRVILRDFERPALNAFQQFFLYSIQRVFFPF